MDCYAGIGNRNTPEPYLRMMQRSEGLALVKDLS